MQFLFLFPSPKMGMVFKFPFTIVNNQFWVFVWLCWKVKSRFWFHEARLKIPLQTELSRNIEIQFFNNSLHSLPKIVNRKPTIYYPTKSAKTYFTAQDISPNLGLKVKFLCPIGTSMFLIFPLLLLWRRRRTLTFRAKCAEAATFEITRTQIRSQIVELLWINQLFTSYSDDALL